MTTDFIPRRNANELVFPTFNGEAPAPNVVLHSMKYADGTVLNIGIDHVGIGFANTYMTRTQVAGLIQTLQSWMLNSKLPEDPQPLKASTSEATTPA